MEPVTTFFIGVAIAKGIGKGIDYLCDNLTQKHVETIFDAGKTVVANKATFAAGTFAAGGNPLGGLAAVVIKTYVTSDGDIGRTVVSALGAGHVADLAFGVASSSALDAAHHVISAGSDVKASLGDHIFTASAATGDIQDGPSSAFGTVDRTDALGAITEVTQATPNEFQSSMAADTTNSFGSEHLTAGSGGATVTMSGCSLTDADVGAVHSVKSDFYNTAPDQGGCANAKHSDLNQELGDTPIGLSVLKLNQAWQNATFIPPGGPVPQSISMPDFSTSLPQSFDGPPQDFTTNPFSESITGLNGKVFTESDIQGNEVGRDGQGNSGFTNIQGGDSRNNISGWHGKTYRP